jgi:hypothetical protein
MVDTKCQVCRVLGMRMANSNPYRRRNGAIPAHHQAMSEVNNSIGHMHIISEPRPATCAERVETHLKRGGLSQRFSRVIVILVGRVR